MGVVPAGPGPDQPRAYPPEPWHLHGHALVGVWLLPRRATPAPHSPRTRTISILGRAVVAAAWFAYTEPSPLTYNEVMSTVLVRDGWVPRVSITRIWVDSPASMAGGRELWAIPKALADFESGGSGHYGSPGLGRCEVRRRRPLPVRIPLAFTTAQDRDGALVVAPVRGSARLGLARARWTFAPDGPLGFLAGRRPLLALSLHPFRLVFGR